MTKTEDRQLDRRDHLEVVAGLHHRLEVARTRKIAFDRLAQRNRVPLLLTASTL